MGQLDRPLTTVRTYLDFEKPIAELESKVAELQRARRRRGCRSPSPTRSRSCEQKAQRRSSTPIPSSRRGRRRRWRAIPSGPHCLDYVNALIEDFTPLAGDRYFAEDEAIVGGLGRFRGRSVVVIGHEKGSDTESRIRHNFGMAKPEGYRKAVRLMELAEQVRAAGDHAGRHRRRLPRHRRRRARPGRGDRPLDRLLPRASACR